MRRERFFLGLSEIATYYAGLQAGLEELGHDAVLVNLVPHRFGRARWRGSIPWPIQVACRLAEVRTPTSFAWRYVNALSRLVVLIWAALRFDVFVFSFGSTFFAYRELPLLRRLGKRIVYIYHGTDHRPSYLDGSEMAPDREVTIEECIALTTAKKARIGRIERYATTVVGNPLSSHLHERLVVHFGVIGIPHATVELKPRADDGVVRILHSPSHPAAKGSAEIRAAVSKLRHSDANVEYTELTNVPHDVVLTALAETDIAIDQLYSDVAMAGFATEALARGCTVIVGSYGVAEIRATPGPEPPVVLCHPDDLAETLARVVSNRDERLRRSAKGRAFVLERCAPADVAARLIGAIDNPDPVAFDPAGIRYCHGAGLSEAVAQSLVRSVLDQGGQEALCVSDKPELEQALTAFALDPLRYHRAR